MGRTMIMKPASNLIKIWENSTERKRMTKSATFSSNDNSKISKSSYISQSKSRKLKNIKDDDLLQIDIVGH